jgi:16S rRNA U516 pseudouridylate synthase RsuA-like enzyme
LLLQAVYPSCFIEERMLERLQNNFRRRNYLSPCLGRLILNGCVTVNGIVVSELGSKADPARDIAVNGKQLGQRETCLHTAQ